MIYKNKAYLTLVVIVIFILLTLFSFLKPSEDSDEYFFAEEKTTKKIEKNFFVDVKGAVNKPGVYEFYLGDRVITAIEKAGGLTKKADTSNINLSQRLNGEMVVYVFTSAEIKSGAEQINCDTSCNCEIYEINNCYEKIDTNSKVNINKATLDDLIKLSGIGNSKAEAILRYREENGLFNSIENLMDVTGIGEKLFDSIKEFITI